MNARAGGREGVNTRFSTSRTSIRTRVGGSDDVVIRRKAAKRYVYSEPSTTVVEEKEKAHRYVYDEPSVYLKRKKKVRSTVIRRSGTKPSAGSLGPPARKTACDGLLLRLWRASSNCGQRKR